jgi:hypothetical protein
MYIEIDDKDYEFLKELQHELNTQDTDGNAQPVFWGIMETHERAVPEGCGDDYRISYDDGWMTLEEAVKSVEENLSDYESEKREIWETEVDKDDPWQVVDFMRDNLKWDSIHDVYEVKDFDELCRYTGAFLTKRAAKEYVEKYSYNHERPKTYAMTAVRNFELQRLLNILRSINFLNGNN